MREIGTRLGKGADAIKRRHRGITKAAELWKYKPHPMAPLTAGLQFRQNGGGNGGLHGGETLKLKRISDAHCAASWPELRRPVRHRQARSRWGHDRWLYPTHARRYGPPR